MRKYNKSKRTKYRKRARALQIIKTVKTSMKGELYILKHIANFTDITASDFTYGGDDREEVRNYFDKICAYNSISPLYNKDLNQQLNGGDYCYNGIFIDLKTNGADKDRACFELYKDSNGTYHFKQSKDSLIIACFMKKYSELVLVASGLIEMLANRNTKLLPIPADFYIAKNIFYIGKNPTNDEVTNVYIRYDILKKLVRYYNAYYCTNDTVKYFLANGFTLLVNTSEYDDYMKTVDAKI